MPSPSARRADLLATGSDDGTARLIRTADGSEAARIEHGEQINAVAFSPKGDLLATGSNDSSARLIRTADGSEVARIEHGDGSWPLPSARRATCSPPAAEMAARG